MKKTHIQQHTDIESVITEILFIYNKIANSNSVKPSATINKLFRRLVGIIEQLPGDVSKEIQSRPEIQKITKKMRALCSQGEYEMEISYSKKKLSEFPYLKNYRKLSAIEEKYFTGNKILFIGSGPLPLSVYMYRKDLNITVIDKSTEVLKHSKDFFLKRKREVRHIKSDAVKFNKYIDFDTVVLAALVGTEAQKNKIVHQILSQCKRNTTIIVRTAEGLGELLYPRFTPVKHSKIREIAYVPVPKDVISPLVVIKSK